MQSLDIDRGEGRMLHLFWGFLYLTSHFIFLKVKVNVTVHAVMANRGSRGIAPLFLKLGTRCGLVTSTPRSLYSRESTLYQN